MEADGHMSAVKHGIFAQFTDPETKAPSTINNSCDPLQLRAARLHSIETRLRTEESEHLIFTDETDARLLLSNLQPSAQSQQLLEVLKASQQPEPKVNDGDNLTTAISGLPRADSLSRDRFTREAERDHRPGCSTPANS